MKKKSSAHSKNLHLAVYFGFVVFFIILVSFAFKAFEVVKKSRFDGGNLFTVAVVTKTHTTFLSISPKDNSIVKLTLKDVGGMKLDELKIPYDGYIVLDSSFDENPKNYIPKLFFSSIKDKSNLTVLDMFRLSLLSKGINSENIIQENFSINDVEDLEKFSSDNFKDPVLTDENISVEIINSAGESGLGNTASKIVTNLGGNVVLVSTSKKTEEKSVILIKNESYTTRKLSKIFNIKAEVMTENSLSDVIIVLGKDRVEE